MDFITKLLEGTCEDNKDEIIDEKTCTEAVEMVDNSGLPFSTLIESVCTDFQIGINRAEEVYEMACIVGGTRVVSEGTGQTGAQAVLEGAVKNFFAMIAEKLHDLWNWIVGIVRSIKDKFKKKGKEVAQEAKEAAPKAKEQIKKQKSKAEEAKAAGTPEKAKPIKVPETLTLIDINTGEKFMSQTLKNIETVSNGISTPGINIDWNESEYKETMEFDASEQNILKELVCKDGILQVSSVEELKSFIREKYMNKSRKIDEDLAEPLIDEMLEVCALAGTDSVSNVEKFMSPLTNKIKNLETAAKLYSMKAPDDAKGKAYFSKISTMLNKISHIYMSIVNERATIINNAATAYSNFIKKVANRGSSATTESTDYSVFFESSDMVDDIDDEEAEEGCCKEAFNFEGTSLAGFLSV